VWYKLDTDYANSGFGDTADIALTATCRGDTCPNISNGSAHFDGVNDALRVPSYFSLGGPISVAAWVKSSSPRVWERIIDFGDNETKADNIVLGRARTGTAINWEIRTNGSQARMEEEGFFAEAGVVLSSLVRQFIRLSLKKGFNKWGVHAAKGDRRPYSFCEKV
jgi:hypothetical protein